MARRPEVIGRKPRAVVGDKKQRAEADEPPARLAYSIPEFCDAVGISEGMFYKLKKQNKAPREAKIGTRTVISFEAATKWLRAREVEIKTEVAE